MTLTDTAIRNAKPGDKKIRLNDGRGLYLLVTPKGAKWWRIDYAFDGKRKTLSLGVYPDVSLKMARERRDAARQKIADGIDPSVLRKTQKTARADRAANSFEMVTREWFAKHSPNWANSYSGKILRRLERYIFPYVGARPISEITAPELLTVLRRIENCGALETTHRIKQICGQVFRYAIATGRAERDPSADLRGALPPASPKRFAAITDPRAIGELLRAIDGYRGDFKTKCALQLAPLVFVRPGELRGARWQEIDLDTAEWRILGERMKGRRDHLVPLSTQAVSILRELHKLTGTGQFLFPSVRTPARYMSENTVNGALRRLGYTGNEMTGHGFRAMASTILNEQGWPRDAIERQLAHVERDRVRAAYHRAEYLAERRRMMQGWADYLDGLRQGAVVVPIRRVE